VAISNISTGNQYKPPIFLMAFYHLVAFWNMYGKFWDALPCFSKIPWTEGTTDRQLEMQRSAESRAQIEKKCGGNNESENGHSSHI